MLRTINDNKELDKSLTWIRPDGGIGEALILSGLLYEINRLKGKKFGIFRQMPHSMILSGHPAAAQFGIPGDDFTIKTTAYRLKETPGAGDKRPYNIISRLLEGEVVGKENIWVAIGEDIIKSIKFFPVKDGAVFISTGREYAGKLWDINKWNSLAVMLEKHTGMPVIQIGGLRDDRVSGAFDLRGKAGVKQSLALLREKASLLICVDNFPVMAAKWAQKQAVVLWGSAERAAYGYEDQINIEKKDDTSDNMSAITTEEVFELVKKLLPK